ncbi:AbaSI family restriction endonuclease [Clostridium sp. UBA3061]|uniref:AbaSI family restriction endonuclease n=1 Tax=Clostridium sp. UBA3061 TaxID=1946353 RepID=UPI003217046B
MDKLEFIIRQLAKTNKKNYENYVVSRIWHKLDSIDIKFITQQYVLRAEGKYALTDMYFPQISLHIEVDEPHHKENIVADEIREADIVNIINHKIMRVDISKGLENINNQVDDIVIQINSSIKELGDKFVPWNLEKETSPETYIENGYISLEDNVAFMRGYEACNCFGLNYKAFQRGEAKHPIEKDTSIWLPKLYPNGEWDNSISYNEDIIYEKAASTNQKHYGKQLNVEEVKRKKRIVFAKVRGPLGDIMYRFKGLFQLDEVESVNENCFVWRKTSDTVKTYRAI